MARVRRGATTTTGSGPIDQTDVRADRGRARLADARGACWTLVSAFALTGLAALGAAGCANEGIGDPCIPENVPPGGFDPREAYVETSSVQCRTRVCIVDRLLGDPTNICDDNGLPAGCASATDVEASVYCTCRCDGPEGVADFCKCPEGFKCKATLNSGGVGIRGSYCIRPKVGD